MVSSCSAFGCTYRYKKGDNIGLHRFPTKNEKLCRKWALALRRQNWWPNSTSRICGQHFVTGKPSRDKNHIDYVPSVFTFNQHKCRNIRKKHWQKVAEEEASQRVKEVIYCAAAKNDIPGYRPLRPKLDGVGVPFVIKAVKVEEDVMKENNIGNEKTNEMSSRNEGFLIHQEIAPVPQHFSLEKKDTKVSAVKARKRKRKVSASSTISRVENDPLEYVETSFSNSDDSTLTAESSVPVSDNDDEPCMIPNKTITGEDEPCMSPIKTITGDDDEVTENLSNQALDYNASSSAVESEYSEFKSASSDTKEILAIKLETMLAVNISLQQKVKIYQTKCKNYEKEITELKNIIKKLKQKNPLLHPK